MGRQTQAALPAKKRRQTDGFVSLNCTANPDGLGHPAGRHPLRSAWRGKKSKAASGVETPKRRTASGWLKPRPPKNREAIRCRKATRGARCSSPPCSRPPYSKERAYGGEASSRGKGAAREATAAIFRWR